MENELAAASIGWSDLLNGILALAFAGWSLVLRGARDDLRGVRDDLRSALEKLTHEIAELRKDFNMLSTRVSVVEVQQKHLHPEER